MQVPNLCAGGARGTAGGGGAAAAADDDDDDDDDDAHDAEVHHRFLHDSLGGVDRVEPEVGGGIRGALPGATNMIAESGSSAGSRARKSD